MVKWSVLTLELSGPQIFNFQPELSIPVSKGCDEVHVMISKGFDSQTGRVTISIKIDLELQKSWCSIKDQSLFRD